MTKDSALSRAMEMKRIDLVELLLKHRASVTAIDFGDVCRTVDYDLMKRMLHLGVDPAERNGFADALHHIKARPLLRFYKDHVAAYPTLKGQVSLALCQAIEAGDERWAAMLRWAGADPFMEVPCELEADWDFDDDFGDTAAACACASGNPALVKLLKLKPTTEQAGELLERVTSCPSAGVLNELFKVSSKDQFPVEGGSASKAVERLVSYRVFSYGFAKYSVSEKEEQAAKCLEMLLDAGARWNPPFEEIKTTRRSLLDNSARFVVRVIRLLVYVPAAADPALVEELCRTSSIRRKINEGDPKLADELKQWFAKPRKG